jgi:hypothetical protein
MRFKIFDNYFLDIDTESHFIKIVSVKRKVETILRPYVKSGMSYYRLYKNGNSNDFSLEELINKIEVRTTLGQLSHISTDFPSGLS